MVALSGRFIDIVIFYRYAVACRAFDVHIPVFPDVRIQLPYPVAKDGFGGEAAEFFEFVIDIDELRVIQPAVFGVCHMIDTV